MKWMLIVLVLGTTPVKTSLLYDDLESCWQAREPIAKETADVVNSRLRWIANSVPPENQEQVREFVVSSLSRTR